LTFSFSWLAAAIQFKLIVFSTLAKAQAKKIIFIFVCFLLSIYLFFIDKVINFVQLWTKLKSSLEIVSKID